LDPTRGARIVAVDDAAIVARDDDTTRIGIYRLPEPHRTERSRRMRRLALRVACHRAKVSTALVRRSGRA
jgi:hypothetical protein